MKSTFPAISIIFPGISLCTFTRSKPSNIFLFSSAIIFLVLMTITVSFIFFIRFSYTPTKMSFAHEPMCALDRRLEYTLQSHISINHATKREELEIDPDRENFICGECAWATSAGIQSLADHFTNTHLWPVVCTECGFRRRTRDGLERHFNATHRFRCSTCQNADTTSAEARYHRPCMQNSEGEGKVIATNKPVESTEPSEWNVKYIEGSIRLFRGNVLYPKTSTQTPKANSQSPGRTSSIGSSTYVCPDPGCLLQFPDFNALYEHYAPLHPPALIRQNREKPFKCPFCSKTYQVWRHAKPHMKFHQPKGLELEGQEGYVDQETLIRQSHVAMAKRSSLASP